LHHYSNGLQQGEYRVFYPDGTPRIEGRYINDNKSGEWIFFTEAGDTAKVVVFD
jgi:antitoxin component YwqK of YwqJK toxin-antitoxin module